MAHGPVNHACYNRAGTETESNREKGKKIREEIGREAEKPNSCVLCQLAFAVKGSGGTQQNEWNYWAFIKQTAGPVRNLKATAKEPTRSIYF